PHPLRRQRHRGAHHPQLRIQPGQADRPHRPDLRPGARDPPHRRGADRPSPKRDALPPLRHRPPLQHLHLRLCGRGPDRRDAPPGPGAAAASTPDTFDQVVADALPGIFAVLDDEHTAGFAAALLRSSYWILSWLYVSSLETTP